MGKTIERVDSVLSIKEMESMLAEYRCGHIRKAQLEKTVGLLLPKIERKVRIVNLSRILERR